MKIDIVKNASRNIVFSVIRKVYGIVLSFVLRTVMIHMLGVEYAGLNGLFTSVLNILNLAELGVGSAIVYSMYVPIARDDRQKISALLNVYRTFCRAIGLAILVMGLCCIPFLHHFVDGDIPDGLNLHVLFLLHLLTTVFSYWFFSYRSALVTAFQRSDVISSVNMIVSSAEILGQILVLVLIRNYYLFLAIGLVAAIMKNLLVFRWTQKQYPEYRAEGRLEREENKIITGHIRDIFLNKFGGVIVNSVDAVVISAVMGVAILGRYQNYFYILSSVSGIVVMLYRSCCAGIGNKLALQEKKNVYDTFENMTFWIIMICAVCSSMFLGFYQPFIRLWAGEENLLAFGIVISLCIYFYVFQLMGLAGMFADAGGTWRYDRFRPFLEGILNLTLNLILVNYIGLYGILWSTILSMAVFSFPWLLNNIFRNVFERKAGGYVIRMLTWLAVALGGNGCIVLLFGERQITSLGGFLLRGVVCVAVPAVSVLVLFGKSKQFGWMKAILARTLQPVMCSVWKIQMSVSIRLRHLCGKHNPAAAGERNRIADKKVYLTFDDGPGPYTEQLLDILKKYQVKATFFVTGREKSDLIRRIREEGHSIGNHTCSHRYRDVYAQETAFMQELEEMDRIIFEQAGIHASLMRFPGGSSNTVSCFNRGIMTRLTGLVESKGYTYFDWNVDSDDAGAGLWPGKVYRNVIRGIKARKESVVLMHDNRKHSVITVERILLWGMENGCVFLPLTEESPTMHHDLNN